MSYDWITKLITSAKLRKNDYTDSNKNDLVKLLNDSSYNTDLYEWFSWLLASIWVEYWFSLSEFNDIFADILVENNHLQGRLDSLQKLLLTKINQIISSWSPEQEIDYFLNNVLWHDNLVIVENYIKQNTSLHDTSDKEWLNFLKNAWDKLVKPVIAWWMWWMWVFNFLTKWWVSSFREWEDILNIPGVDNIIQAIITLSVLFILKRYLTYKDIYNEQ